eukprot:TRINITY_DN4584_c0_g1_i1.p1 TRINITY_DN4584_c0_g1~~TRINITY_DN4584_c0_g1_i1.p1  ORF type:complete len:176 (-),score=23.18 TRINITY_DN4584_c0_g1_i1:11-538(-)
MSYYASIYVQYLKDSISSTSHLVSQFAPVKLASDELSPIPNTYIENQMNRDCGQHHLTVVTKKEFADLAPNAKSNPQESHKIMTLFSNLIADWQILGLGRVTEPYQTTNGKTDINEAYFLVVDWPAANQVRQNELKLTPKDFHITLGFKYSDIHSISKDQSTLIVYSKSYRDNYQ